VSHDSAAKVHCRHVRVYMKVITILLVGLDGETIVLLSLK